MPSSTRLLLAAAACAAPLSLVACGGGSDGPETIVPTGAHHQYVVSAVSIPTTSAQVTQFGLDLGTKTSSKLDGTPENRLGELLATLSSPVVKFDIQGPLTTAVNAGSLILLVDLQAEALANASAVGFTVEFGANPMPPACISPTDCGHHLSGSGSFSVAAGSPSETLTGKIVNGAFNGGPGNLSLQISLGSTTPITLDLLHARVQATGITDTGIMTANVGGLVTQAELMTQIGPAIAAQVATIVDRDCTGTRTPPGCGCGPGSTGQQLFNLLEGVPTATADCNITVAEIFGHPLVQGMLTPDSCSMDSCTAPDSLSIGVQVKAVKASF
jgi:hypothetical protein